MINQYRERLLAFLLAHSPFDETEARHWAHIISFLRRTPLPFSRTTTKGHITGSAILINQEKSHMLLIWHEKLQCWLQPGGHCEADDQTTAACALRELLEETGLSADDVQLASEQPFDVDVHPIPAFGDESRHHHYDVRYLFTLRSAGLPTIHHNGELVAEWRPLTDVAKCRDDSLARLAQKILQQ